MGATLFGAPPPRDPRAGESAVSRRRDNLAVAYQNVLTVIVRLRAQRQTIADAQAFRQQIIGALKQTEREAAKKLYPVEDVRLATSAVVAFLDESILNSNIAVFSDWARMPLQEEMYGNARAGEIFFQNVDMLLARGDSNGVADLLEIYLLCILLGFKGKYGLLGGGLRQTADQISDKIRRIRGPLYGFSPHWMVPEGAVSKARDDRWVRTMGLAALITWGVAALLFLVFNLLLTKGISSIQSLACGLPKSLGF
jgi:type VI secretion system protein ImpK